MGSGKEQVQPSASLTMLTVGMLICGARKRTSSVICFVGHADVRMPICGVRKRTSSVICFADHADCEDADLWSQERNKLSHLLR